MRVGPFEIGAKLGQGGMATVWSGAHHRLGTLVAFKILRESRSPAEHTLRFFDEVRALARMNHPRIVRVFDAGLCSSELATCVGAAAGTPYLVMEAVSGGPLAREHAPDWPSTRALLLDLLEALAHAHARDVIHRDIKPSNVLVDAHGLVRLGDFGISRIARVDRGTGKISGTPSFMAPEQAAGDYQREGPWTDLYALGCLAYWLVSGSAPFSGSPREVIDAQLLRPPRPLQRLFPVPDEFVAWCMRLLEKDPQARFTRAADAACALRVLGGPQHGLVAGGAREPPGRAANATITIVEAAGNGSIPAGRPPRPSRAPIPEDWRTGEAPVAHQLLSTGPGMLVHREPPLHGRFEERDRLWSAFRQASDGDVVAAVTGPVGIGKSALLRWLAHYVHETGSGHTLAFADEPLLDMRRQLVEWWAETGGRSGATAFYAVFGGFDREADWDVEQVGRLSLGLDVAAQVLTAVHARWTQRLSYDRTVVCLGSDAQAFRTLVTAARRAPGRRLLLLEGATDVALVTIELEPLAASDLRAMLCDLVGLAPSTASAIAHRADGNPAAAMEWIVGAVRSGVIEPTSRGFELTVAVDAITSGSERWQASVAGAFAANPRQLRAARLCALADAVLSDDETVRVCRDVQADAVTLIDSLNTHGLAIPAATGLRFAHPLARRALVQSDGISESDYRVLWHVFAGSPKTARRMRLAGWSGLRAGIYRVADATRIASELTLMAEVEAAGDLLIVAVEHADDDDELLGASLALAETYLTRQMYAAALDALGALPSPLQDDPKARAMLSFLSLRTGAAERIEIPNVAHDGLGPTTRRLMAYAYMDLGATAAARSLLLGLPDDDPGRSYAFARLHFVLRDWAAVEKHGLEAVRLFERSRRPDGVVAAMDLVATARLEQGDDEGATEAYQDNLRDATRIGAPLMVHRINLALCLLQCDREPDLFERLMEEALAEVVQHGRRDIEHSIAAARLLHALRGKQTDLAKHRLEQLLALGSGPWLQPDSLSLLEEAIAAAPAELRDGILMAADLVQVARTESRPQAKKGE